MRDILFKAEDYIFDVRTVGILVKGGKILVQRDKGGNEYALPGGHTPVTPFVDGRMFLGMEW